MFLSTKYVGVLFVFLSEYLGIVVSNTRRQSRTIVFKVADVKVTVDGKELSTKEAYELTVDVTNDVIEIKAKEPEGAFYGAMTLLNLKDEKGRVSSEVFIKY